MAILNSFVDDIFQTLFEEIIILSDKTMAILNSFVNDIWMHKIDSFPTRGWPSSTRLYSNRRFDDKAMAILNHGIFKGTLAQLFSNNAVLNSFAGNTFELIETARKQGANSHRPSIHPSQFCQPSLQMYWN
jgi:hypothetical protein